MRLGTLGSLVLAAGASIGVVTGVSYLVSLPPPDQYAQSIAPNTQRRVVWAASIADNGTTDVLNSLSITTNPVTFAGYFTQANLWVLPSATPFDCNSKPSAVLAATPNASGTPVSFGGSGLGIIVKNGTVLYVAVDASSFSLPTPGPGVTPSPVAGVFGENGGLSDLVFGSAGPQPALWGMSVSLEQLPAEAWLFLDKNWFSKGSTVGIRFRLTNTKLTQGEVLVNIFDLSGSLVRTIDKCHLVGGTYEAAWDGTGPDGKYVGSGQYYVSIQAVFSDPSNNGVTTVRHQVARKKVGFLR